MGVCRPFSVTGLAPVTAGDWSDSLAFDAVFPGAHAPNGHAVLRLHVAAGTTLLPLSAYSTWHAGAGGGGNGTHPDFGIGVYVDGVWSQRLIPAADGPALLFAALDGAAHDVDVVSSFVNFQTTGVFVTGYGSGATVRAQPAPTSRIVFYGDSIIDGLYAYPIAQTSAFMQLRAAYSGRIALQGWGGLSLYHDITTGFGSAAAVAARLVALAQLGGATVSRRIWIGLGWNDWGGGEPWFAADYGAALGNVADAINALDPTISVFISSQTIGSPALEATANVHGQTPAAYRSAAVAAASGRAWVTSVSGPSLFPAAELDADGTHPSQTGQNTMAASIATVLGI